MRRKTLRLRQGGIYMNDKAKEELQKILKDLYDSGEFKLDKNRALFVANTKILVLLKSVSPSTKGGGK